MDKDQILERVRNRMVLSRNLLQLMGQMTPQMKRMVEISEKSDLAVGEIDELIREIKKGSKNETSNE